MNKRAWLYPDVAERKYASLFKRYLRELQAETIARLKAAAMVKRDAEEDEDESWSEELAALFSGLAAWALTRRQQMNTVIVIIYGDVNRFNDNQFRAVVRSTVGITLPPSQSLPRGLPELITDPAEVRKRFGDDVDVSRFEAWNETVKKQWVRNNELYVEQVFTNYIADAERIVRDGYAKKLTQKQIIELLTKKFDISDKRARFFVRDQVGNINAELQRKRALSLGKDKYRWRDRRDERVRGNPNGLYPSARPSHWHRNGEVFSWNRPPVDGHPGEPPGCRCGADIIF